MGNGGKGRRPRSGYGWGWLVFSLGALVAGATIVLFYIVFVGAECRRPGTSWGDSRAFFCRDVMRGFVASSMPWVVLVAVSVAIIAGLVGGTMTMLRRGRRMRGAWLTSTAIVYALLIAGATWVPNAGSVEAGIALAVLPLAALMTTGLLAVWVGITGGLGAIVLAVRRLLPTLGAGTTRVPSRRGRNTRPQAAPVEHGTGGHPSPKTGSRIAAKPRQIARTSLSQLAGKAEERRTGSPLWDHERGPMGESNAADFSGQTRVFVKSRGSTAREDQRRD